MNSFSMAKETNVSIIFASIRKLHMTLKADLSFACLMRMFEKEYSVHFRTTDLLASFLARTRVAVSAKVPINNR